MAETAVDELFSDQRTNAVLAWVLVGALLLVGVGSFLTGTDGHDRVRGLDRRRNPRRGRLRVLRPQARDAGYPPARGGPVVRLRDRVGLGVRRQKQATYVMELALVGIIFIGIERGSTGVIVNALVGLLVTQIPPLLERDYDIPMDPALTLWITTTVFLHAVGVLGLPGSEANWHAWAAGRPSSPSTAWATRCWIWSSTPSAPSSSRSGAPHT